MSGLFGFMGGGGNGGGGGGGGSSVYYLNGSINQGVFGGDTYYQMNKTANFVPNADFSINADGYITQFITNVGDPNLSAIPSGAWEFQLYFSASSSGGSPRFYIELYKYDGAVFTLISDNSTIPEGITGGTAIDLYTSLLSVPSTTLTTTDRLAIRIYVFHSGRTITLHTQSVHICKITTTFTNGILSLNGLTDSVQFIQTGTGGTDFNITQVGIDTNVLNLPIASAVNTGKLSNTDWTTFDNKQNALTFGDLTESTSSILTFTGNIGAIIGAGTTIEVSQASSLQDGYLSSADWNTFNNKFDLPPLSNGSVLFSNGTTIAEDNSNFFWNNTNKRLGIGTSTPSTTLEIVGASNSIIQNINDTTTIITTSIFTTQAYFGTSTAHILNLITNGNTRLTILDTGNIGINTTSPTNLLDVNGTSIFRDTINIKTNGTLGVLGFAVTLKGGAGTDLNLGANNVNRIYITSGGNVGVGTGLPNYALDVIGSVSASASLYVSGTAGNGLYFNATPNSAITISGSTKFSGSFSEGFQFIYLGDTWLNYDVNNTNGDTFQAGRSLIKGKVSAFGDTTSYFGINVGATPNAILHAQGSTAMTDIFKLENSSNVIAMLVDDANCQIQGRVVSPDTATYTFVANTGYGLGFGSGEVSLVANNLGVLKASTSAITISDAVNFVFDTITGTKIGTSTTQKIGFFNATPITQPTAVTSTQEIADALTNLGLLASSTITIAGNSIYLSNNFI